MDGISSEALVHLIAKLQRQAVVVDKDAAALTASLPKDLYTTSARLSSIIFVGNHWSQALGLIFDSPSILNEVGEIDGRSFSVVLKHGVLLKFRCRGLYEREHLQCDIVIGGDELPVVHQGSLA